MFLRLDLGRLSVIGWHKQPAAKPTNSTTHTNLRYFPAVMLACPASAGKCDDSGTVCGCNHALGNAQSNIAQQLTLKHWPTRPTPQAPGKTNSAATPAGLAPTGTISYRTATSPSTNASALSWRNNTINPDMAANFTGK
jgi:hypothetical protein